MEALVKEHATAACWAAGDPWPSSSTAQDVSTPTQMRQGSSPLLTLQLGPFSVEFLSRPLPPPLQDSGKAVDGICAPGQLLVSADATRASQEEEGGQYAAVLQLQKMVAARDPLLAQRLAATGESVDARFFSRWLKARGGCPETAAVAIMAHAAWRDEFVGAAAFEASAAGTSAAAGAVPPAGLGSPGGTARGIPEASIEDELAARKVFLQGCDARGCPVVVVKAARHDMGRRDLRHTKRLIAYVLDNACAAAELAANPSSQICCLFDLSGLRPRNLDVKVLAAIFEMLQQHYPERLNSLYFLNAPFLFWGVWRVVSPFVHAPTRRKIHFVAGRPAQEELAERIPAQVLPAEYGGDAELIPIEEAVAARRQQQEQAAAAAAQGAADTSGRSSPSSSGSRKSEEGSRPGGAVTALRQRAGGALRTTGRFVHHKVVRPVGGAAAGAAKALVHHHQQLLGLRNGGEKGKQVQLSEQAQRSLLAQVVLRHVLLVGLLLSMLRRVLLRRPGGSAEGCSSCDRSKTPAGEAEAATKAALSASSSDSNRSAGSSSKCRSIGICTSTGEDGSTRMVGLPPSPFSAAASSTSASAAHSQAQAQAQAQA